MNYLAGATLAVLLSTGAAFAQDFPSGPVTIIVPYSPGGATDTTARALAVELEKVWGQPIVIENRPGAGSMIGTALLAQAEPDGQTLLINTAAFTTAPALQAELPFDPMTEITPILMISTSPYTVVAGAEVQANTLSEFLEEAQSRPIFFASAGVGSSSHFTEELLIQQAGLDAEVVHFSGGGEAQTNLMGGHADIYISTTQSVMPYVNNGQVKALGVLGSERFEMLPDLESSGELGIEGIDVDGWNGLFGPGGMSPEVIAAVAEGVNEAIASESFQQNLSENFVEAGTDTPEEFAARVYAEMEVWKDLAESRGISAE